MCIHFLKGRTGRKRRPLSSVTLLPSLLFISSPFAWPFDFISKSLLLWQLCLRWWDGTIGSVWQCVPVCVCEGAGRQTDSQTAVPAESAYHHQGRLNRVEQINYSMCVCARVINKVFKKAPPVREVKALKPVPSTKINQFDKLLVSSQVKKRLYTYTESVTQRCSFKNVSTVLLMLSSMWEAFM